MVQLRREPPDPRCQCGCAELYASDPADPANDFYCVNTLQPAIESVTRFSGSLPFDNNDIGVYDLIKIKVSSCVSRCNSYGQTVSSGTIQDDSDCQIRIIWFGANDDATYRTSGVFSLPLVNIFETRPGDEVDTDGIHCTKGQTAVVVTTGMPFEDEVAYQLTVDIADCGSGNQLTCQPVVFGDFGPTFAPSYQRNPPIILSPQSISPTGFNDPYLGTDTNSILTYRQMPTDSGVYSYSGVA